MSKTEDLIPLFDNAKSFYRKAYVKTDVYDNKVVKTLVSYNTDVAVIVETDSNLELSILNPEVESSINEYDYINALSKTTVRHINEFIQQNGFEKMTVVEMRKKVEGD